MSKPDFEIPVEYAVEIPIRLEATRRVRSYRDSFTRGLSYACLDDAIASRIESESEAVSTLRESHLTESDFLFNL